MKKLAKLFSLLAVLGLLTALVACGGGTDPDPDPDPVTSINALGGFVEGGDAVYTLDINSENALSLTFDKGEFSYANVNKALEGDFTSMLSLGITLQGDGSAVLVKLETSDGSVAREVQVNANATQQSFDWDLSAEADLLADLAKIYIFAAPGKTDVVGSILISELMFREDAAAEGIIESGFADFVTPDPNMYDGTGDVFSVMNFYDGGDGLYDVTSENGEYTADYSKPEGSNVWAFMRADLSGAFSDFARLVFEFTSTADVDVLLKIEGTAGNKEVRVTGTGEKQVYTFDLLSLLPAQLDNSNKIVIFGAPGVTGNGSITLHSVRFEKANVDINSMGWTALDAGVYTPTDNNDGTVTVDYNKVDGNQWSVMVLDIPAEYQMLNILRMSLSGAEGNNFIIKPNDDGALEQNVTLDASGMVDLEFANPDGFTKIVLFAYPNVAPISGQFVITNAELDYVAAAFDPTVVVDFNNEWSENDAGTYSVTYDEDGTASVLYVNSGWQFMSRSFDIEAVTGLNTLTITLSGQAGKKVLVKPNDDGNLETWVEFEENDKEYTLTFMTDGFSRVLLFADGGDGGLGTFYIHDATLSYTYMPEEINDMNGYVITEGDNGLDVAYDKGGNGYAFLGIDFDALLTEGLNTLTVTLQGTAGESVLLKPNDMGSLETLVTFTDDQPVETVITYDSFTKLIMFAMPGDGTATGSFTLVDVKVSYVAPDFDGTQTEDVNGDWVSLDDGVYTFTDVDNGIQVDYNKSETQAWSVAIATFDAEAAEGFNALYVKVSGGTAGKQVLLKPNDDGALEVWLTLDDNGEAEALITNAAGFTKLVIFGEAGQASVSGSFVLETVELRYAVDMNQAAGWVSLVDGAYTLSDVAEGTQVEYAKNAGDQWAAIKLEVSADTAGLNTLLVTITGGTEGQQVLLKPNDAQPLEAMLTFDANGEIHAEVIIDATITSMIVFVQPGQAPATGTVTIGQFMLTYTEQPE